MTDPHPITADRRWFYFAGALIAGALVLIPHEDRWAASAMRLFNRTVAELLDGFLVVGEMYPSTEGIILISFFILTFCGIKSGVLWRWGLGLVLVATINTGLKVLFSRQRPVFSRRDDYERLLPAEESGRWFAWEDSVMASGRIDPDAAFFAFPSGHSAVAGFIAMYLTYHFPRGRYIWWGLALLTVFHRFDRSSHYISDCFAGIASGLLICHLVLPNSFLPRWCGRQIEKIRARFTPVRADSPTSP